MVGLFTGATVVSVYGKFLLGGILAFFGLLVFARFKRGSGEVRSGLEFSIFGGCWPATPIFAIPGPGTIKLFTSMAETNGGAKGRLLGNCGALMAGDAVWMVLALSGVAALAAAHSRRLMCCAATLVRRTSRGLPTLIRHARETLGEGKVILGE